MAFQLEHIVPWGRSFDEYARMFSLTDADLNRTILGCGDGPASFNATMHQKGQHVVSVDPIYQFSSEQIRQRIQEAFPKVMEQLIANQAAYVWTTIRSPEELGQTRMTAMEEFLVDYELGKREGRYQFHELPELPFADGQFDLALCSHLLFTYSTQLSEAFHCQALLEMCRVAKEVRVFPLLCNEGHRSPYIDKVRYCLNQHGYHSEIQPVNYEFQRGSNEMLCVFLPSHD